MNLEDVLNNLHLLTEAEQVRLFEELEALERLQGKEKAQTSFLAFVERMWPEFIAGRHHKIMADAFERVANGTCKRLIICLPPRHTKSEFASYLLPAWYLGRFPHRKVIQASHTAELAMGFGRKVRNLIDTDTYASVYPGVGLQVDSKAAGRWGTNHGGTYFAIGVSGSVSGKGADLLILDDVHSEQEAIIAESNPDIYDKVYEWFMTGPRQRLQPNGSILVVNTRWSKRDLTGRLLKDSVQRGGDEWEIIEFPALFEDDRPLWPEFWSKEELIALRASLPLSRWSAQYLQNPVSESAAIIKREWWQRWEPDTPPQCEFIMQSWDTAFLATERADYSACTTWGVFYRDDGGYLKPNIILLDAIKGRWEFPDLKLKAQQMYKDWQPDAIIVEAKAAGSPLIFELRRMGLPVQEFTPSRGADKIARLNAVADIFSSGAVWAPNRNWAEMVIEEVASFPAGEHDDIVDTVSQALLRYRKGGFVQLNSDEQDIALQSPRKAAYY